MNDPLELVVWQNAIDGELGVGADELESVRYIVLRRLGEDRLRFVVQSDTAESLRRFFGELPNSQFWRNSE